jgi:putative phage-type endonuclease
MLDLVQGTEAWLLARCGKVTASRVADVVAKTKSGYSASRATYMGELIAERLTGVPASSYSNAAMAWGTATEPLAREAYRAQSFDDVIEVGFVSHPRIPQAGASPDGYVGEEGLVEIKCPNTATHIETLLGGKVPAKYETQMLWQMACTGRASCDFASFDPRLPPEMQLFVKRLERDDTRIAELESEVTAFLAELDEKVAKLTALYRKEAA